MGALDPYSITDKLDAAALSTVTARLEARGRDPFFVRMLDDYLEALEPGRLGRVLEVGCGTGVATRRLAAHPSFAGRIDASDLSPELVRVAEERAREEGCAARIAFEARDALEIAPSQPYDAVVAHTLISHVPDCEVLIEGLARAVSDEGRIAVFDGDYASITFGAERPEDGRALSQAIIEGLIVNPEIMRRMPWIARQAGLRIERSFSYVLAEVGAASFFADLWASLPVLLPRSGRADEATARRWVEMLQGYAEAGTFFGSINFHAYILRRG